MSPIKSLKTILAGGAATTALCVCAHAADFNIPSGELNTALTAFSAQTGVQLVMSYDAVKGVQSHGVKGNLSSDEALWRLLSDTGFAMQRRPSGAIAIVRDRSSLSTSEVGVRDNLGSNFVLAQAAPPRASVETVTVTSSKLGGADVQSIPIAITALSQEQLTATQTAGGPDLVKQVPNLTFSKTNFTGYNIQIRGIGTQAISVTTDPGVAVAFNDIPFIHNHFFEQEFYDVAQVEVLRGPQGTLYGRNATAGVVNLASARPIDQFEAMLSADIGNYKNRRFEGMINLPIVADRLDLRLAGEWTKRDGYSLNNITGKQIDGRDLWSSRLSLRWKPTSAITADFIWEHFQENDDRLRSGKQLCSRATAPDEVLGQSTQAFAEVADGYLNQICKPDSLYSPEAFGVPDSLALPYYGGLISVGMGNALITPLNSFPGGKRDAYAGTTQSRNLRVIESTLDPEYKAKNDTLELNAQWNVTPALTFISQTGYNQDFLWSAEDFNRFNTQPGIFAQEEPGTNGALYTTPDGNYRCFDGTLSIGGNSCDAPGAIPTAYFCDPQLGCSNRLVGEDLSEEHSWQFSQELRLASNFQGPINFSFGGNYLHYEIAENYYVFFNTLTMWAANDGIFGRAGVPWVPGISTNELCLGNGHQYTDPNLPSGAEGCPGYIDPNPLSSLNNQGHNYFLSQNPYGLNSYAMFGEAYYNVTDDVKITAGLRWTDDQKHFVEIPSELFAWGYGYPSLGALDQEWRKWTGRFVAQWTPHTSFTDQTMLYASYAHGYKAGGANPPGAVLIHFQASDISTPTHPLTFEPEYNDAFELGTKNTLFDGAVTLNGDVFYYNYKGYQISEIVDRTSVNLNFDATVKGAELQATWEPIPGLKFGFAGGYEHTRLADGSRAIDLMDRTAGNPNWVVVKPFVTQASNCVLPAYLVAYLFDPAHTGQPGAGRILSSCGDAYNSYLDPVTDLKYVASPTEGFDGVQTYYPIDPSYPGFDPLAGTPGHPYAGQNTYNGIDYGPAPNNGEGFYKNLSGNELPNAPHFTTSLSADYTMPISSDWAATIHGDFYWQSQSWARVINDDPFDRIRGYTNVNLSLLLSDTSGWQVMGYVKNVFDTTAITGTFLNSDDTGLTTNIFLTDPRLFGVRVTKHFDGGADNDFVLFSNSKPQVWLTLGGGFTQLADGWQKFDPAFDSLIPSGLPSPVRAEKSPSGSFDLEGQLSFQPEDSDWVLKAGVRYGRSSTKKVIHKSLPVKTAEQIVLPPFFAKYLGLPTTVNCTLLPDAFSGPCPATAGNREFVDATAQTHEDHVMLDFTLGRDVGLGSAGKGTVGAGVRIAQFDTHTSAEFNVDPSVVFPSPLPFKYADIHHDIYDGKTQEVRSFHGIGPELTWDAEHPIWGSDENSDLAIDWGLNASVLFGRQKANVDHQTYHCRAIGIKTNLQCAYTTSLAKTYKRSRNVAVPNLGGYLGASVRYQNAKIKLGYRADWFSNVIDGGQEVHKDSDRSFYGPYLKVSVGL